MCQSLCPSELDFGLRRNLNDLEVEELLSFLSPVENVVLVPFRSDRRRWFLVFSECFLCKTYSKYLMDNPSFSAYSLSHVIGKAGVPPKVRPYRISMDNFSWEDSSAMLQRRKPSLCGKLELRVRIT